MRQSSEPTCVTYSTALCGAACQRVGAQVLICIAVLFGTTLFAAPSPSESARTATLARPVAKLTEVLPGLWVGGAVPIERMPGWPVGAPVAAPATGTATVTATVTAVAPAPDVAAASSQVTETQTPRRIFAVIDLRTAGEGRGLAEAREAAKAAGVGFVSVPVGRIGPPPDAAVEQLVAVLRNAEGAPVVLQCASGNRAGDVLARYLIRTGVDVDSAIAKSRSVGLSADRAAAIRSAALGHP